MHKQLLINTKKNRGFSLIEVMIAVLIFAFSLIAIAKFTGSLFSMNSFAQQRTEALVLAQQKLADFRSYAKISTTSGYVAYDDITAGNDTVTGSNASYTRTWTVATNTVVGYKIVNINVSWTAQDGSSKSVVLNSIIGKTDPANSNGGGSALPTGTITP